MLADMGSIPDASKGIVQSSSAYVSYTTTNTLYAAPYAVHGGRINLSTFAGNVETVTIDQHWNEFYYIWNGTVNVLPQRYFTSNGELVQPSH